jgi:hypothetical protein
VFNAAPADLRDHRAQREDLTGEELVVMVSSDRVPADPVGGDRYLGDERRPLGESFMGSG